MRINKLVVFAIFSVALLASCRKARVAPDVSNIQADVTIVPFYKELHSLNVVENESNLDEIKKKHGLFFRDFTQRVVGCDAADAKLPLYISKFVDFEANKEVYAECEKQFGDGHELRVDFNQAFKYYKHYFPAISIDKIYLQMSGFSTFMMVDTGYVAISLERYLGENCKFYNLLGDPQYLRRKMIREKIVPDAFKAIAMVDFPDRDSTNNLLSNMVFHGKVLHFVASMVPTINDTLLFDYSAKQLKWAEKNESSAWASLVEKKHIFSTDVLLIQKYIGDGPFTAYYGQDSPPRMAAYLGYQMVEQFVKKNPKITLSELMNINDSQFILRKSGYRP